MIKLPYFLEINKDLLKMERFYLWQKKNLKNDSSIACITGEPIQKNGWYNQLQALVSQKITIINEVYSDIKIIFNTSLADHSLGADTVARLVYESCANNNVKILLIHFNDMQYFEKVKIAEFTKLVCNHVFVESLYSPYHLRAFFNFVQNFQIIENICKQHNIKMYWTSNCYFIRKLPKKYLKKYLNTNCFFIKPGINYHQKVAKKFNKLLTKITE